MKKQLGLTKGVFIFVALIMLIACPVLFAAEETLPTSEEIIAKNVEVMGRKEARKNTYNKKIVERLKYFRKGMILAEKVTAYKERPDKEYILIEPTRPDMEYVLSERIIRSGSNGKIAWTIHPQNGTRLFEPDYKFDRPDVPNKSMKKEGIEKINGKDCYKIVKTPVKGPEKIVYYDKKSYLIVKTKAYYITPEGNNKYETYYEDYKKINGIFFPYKEVRFTNDQKVEELTREIELNIDMPEGIFDIPEEVKSIMDKKQPSGVKEGRPLISGRNKTMK